MIGRQTIGVCGIALGPALAVLMLLTPALSPSAPAQDAAPASPPAGVLRCPECELEFPSDEPKRRVLCPRCGQKRVVMEFSTSSGVSLEKVVSHLRFPMVMAGVVFVLAAGVIVLNRRQKVREAASKAEDQQQAGQDRPRPGEYGQWEQELRSRARRNPKGG